MSLDSANPVIIDYGSGNLRSVAKAFSHVLGREVKVTSDPADLAAASHIVLPGVGAFGDCAAGLRALDGMVAALEEQVLEKKKPFLGICVGMQLLADVGYEHGEHKGLGWIGGEVIAIKPQNGLPVPHMGWNSLDFSPAQKIASFQPMVEKMIDKIAEDVYYVHSYKFECDEKYVVATSSYCGAIKAFVAKDNVFGVQFHPEKSQKSGLQLIQNFLQI